MRAKVMYTKYECSMLNVLMKLIGRPIDIIHGLNKACRNHLNPMKPIKPSSPYPIKPIKPLRMK